MELGTGSRPEDRQMLRAGMGWRGEAVEGQVRLVSGLS